MKLKSEAVCTCGNPIPHFENLSKEDVTRLRYLRMLDACVELRRLTNCDWTTAKHWMLHRSCLSGPPCPYCGTILFTDRTRQCLKCGWDWHDPEHPVNLLSP